MGATNTTNSNVTYFKLKEDKREGETLGRMMFFKQVKNATKWGDGEAFNQLSGTVTNILVKDFEYEGQPKKSLVITISDMGQTFEVGLGLQSFIAQNILNSLAG